MERKTSARTETDATGRTFRVSIVVPTKDSARTIEACLRAARSQTVPVEILVVDNSSTDSTPDLARSFADRVDERGPERSAQRNHGARISTGEYLMFLDSDLLLDPEVAAEGVARLDTDPSLGALVIPESAFGTGFWAQCRVLEKQIYQGDRHVEAARIFRRFAFEEVGGYDEALTGGEDWDLPDRLVAAGWRIGSIITHARHDEGRLRLGETFRKKRYYGRSIPDYLGKSGATGARRLARIGLFRKPSLIFRHPIRFVGLLVLKIVEACGLALGMLDARRAP